MSKDLVKFFNNPPKGGNGRGIETTSPMQPVPSTQVPSRFGAQQGGIASMSGPPSLYDKFSLATDGARSSAVASSQLGQADTRNFARGEQPTQEVNDPSGLQAYDYECWHDGQNRGRIDEGPAPTSGPVRGNPRPPLEPDTSQAYRSDGKKNYPVRK